MKNKHSYINDKQQLKNYKVEEYKIDNDLKALYKVITTDNHSVPKILKTLPLEIINDHDPNFFFMLMKSYQCDNFAIYYENNYDIKKIINLIYNQELNLTTEQLVFLKQFFNDIKTAFITLFDIRIKPIINSSTDNNISNDNITNVLQSKSRILN